MAYAASQEVGSLYPQIPAKNFSESVQLVLPGGEVFSGARAVFSDVNLCAGDGVATSRAYDRVPGFARLTEAAYRLIAGHRTFFYHLTRLTFGKRVLPLQFAKTEWLFLRLLAAIYLIAFASLAVQITGLIGAQGILPLGGYLAAVSKTLGARGYWSMPTIFWLAHGDWFLKAACIAGAAMAVLLLTGILKGIWERLLLVGLYVLYLSLSTAGQDFLSFQWDSLLLETGFLAIFLGNSRVVVLLFRWLLFRLMFLSGVVKLTSHDPVWSDWTALAFHYMTQPLPTPSPGTCTNCRWGSSASPPLSRCSIELAIPFLFFAPSSLAVLGGRSRAVFASFDFPDRKLHLLQFAHHIAVRFSVRRSGAGAVPPACAAIVHQNGGRDGGWPLLILVLSVSELHQMFFEAPFDSENALVRFAGPFQIANTYGLFASMTTTRPEIIVQGSNDGVTWLDYEFPYKAGDLRQPPHWVAPYQPRLDWQMWFAALSEYRATPWFTNFMVRLLQGSPDVLGLLAKNPFPSRPRSTCARSYSIIRLRISPIAARPGIGGRASRADCISRRSR